MSNKFNENDYKLIGKFYYKKSILTKLNLENIETDEIIDVFKFNSDSNVIPILDLSTISGQESLNKAISMGFIYRLSDIKNNKIKSEPKIKDPETKANVIVPELTKEKIVANFSSQKITPIRYIEDNKYIIKANMKYDVEVLKKKLGNEFILFISKLNNIADHIFLNPTTRLIILNEQKKQQIMQSFKIEYYDEEENTSEK
jgi:hypothetical protein